MTIEISSTLPLPDFLGIPWGAARDDARSALLGRDGIVFLDAQSGAQNLMFTGGTYANKSVALWLLQVGADGLHTAKINIRPPASILASEHADMMARLSREYGDPALSNETTTIYTFGSAGAVDGSILLQQTPEGQLLVTYQHQDLNMKAMGQMTGLDVPVQVSSSGCFIATAACGTDAHPDVAALQAFRDRVLLHSPAGRSAIRAYYRLSPPLATWIASKPAVRALVRTAVVGPLARAIGPRG